MDVMNCNQQFRSAATSINSSKVPAIFSRIVWRPGTRNLDWGGGKYDTATEYLRDLGCNNHIYDPFNRSEINNVFVLSRMDCDTATISNVLNVIQEADERKNVVKKCLTHLRPGGILYITVYEGDRSGIGQQSKQDCWQTNMRLKAYLPELQKYNPVTKYGMIIIKKEED